MKKIPFKIRENIAIILFLFSLGLLISSISIYIQFGLLIVIIIGPIFAFISFVVSIIFMPTTKIKDDIKANSNNNQKINKHRTNNIGGHKKEPFISEKEWEEQEEEDDEMIFIEEILEDD